MNCVVPGRTTTSTGGKHSFIDNTNKSFSLSFSDLINNCNGTCNCYAVIIPYAAGDFLFFWVFQKKKFKSQLVVAVVERVMDQLRFSLARMQIRKRALLFIVIYKS